MISNILIHFRRPSCCRYSENVHILFIYDHIRKISVTLFSQNDDTNVTGLRMLRCGAHGFSCCNNDVLVHFMEDALY